MKLIIGLILVLSSSASAQVVKQFNGPLDNGTGTYQYYENDDYKRIFHGKYLYKGDSNRTLVEGSFVDDKRNGLWHFRYDESSPTGTVTDIYKNYLNGKLHGNCLYQKVSKATAKTLIKYSSKFEDNIQVGQISLESNDDYEFGTLNITAFLNDNGVFEGPAFIKYSSFSSKWRTYEDKINYSNGIMTSRVYRDVTDGEVFMNIKRDTLVKYIRKNYDYATNQATIPFLKYQPLKGSSRLYKPYVNITGTSDTYIIPDGSFTYCGKTAPAEGDFVTNKVFTMKVMPSEITNNQHYPQRIEYWLNFWHNECEFGSSDSFRKPPEYCKGVEPSKFEPERVILQRSEY
ncbi:hypothetical protein [Hymenobacter siberiensis]|uniref:hypothetical protein n=1 Tax=Hymenobacter siberiensis TaxID=2848396 RepID=UPI001C1DCFB6|nr:hypothetical protein [Hymenobacter siberiensis]MBU6122601.1 hypothetical protein [Hymenobacter siberiensis]